MEYNDPLTLEELQKIMKKYYEPTAENAQIEPLYGGAYYNNNGDLVFIKKVIRNGPACIVLWSDGDKTISTCEQGDDYNAEMGLIICVLKKIMGNKWVANLFSDWSGISNYKVRSLKDVRKDRREK